jgi:hypothetical protein
MLGVEVTGPPPTKAADLLKRFKVHDAFNHDCFEGHDQVIKDIPGPEAQASFLPVATNQTGAPPNLTPDQRAREVLASWRAKPKLDPAKVVSTWAQKMGWAAAAAAAGQKMEPLVSAPPERVMRQFDAVYRDVPMLVGVQA